MKAAPPKKKTKKQTQKSSLGSTFRKGGKGRGMLDKQPLVGRAHSARHETIFKRKEDIKKKRELLQGGLRYGEGGGGKKAIRNLGGEERKERG